MPRMFSARATWQLLRAGNLPARLRATREGQTAVRPALVGAALGTGVLDVLAERRHPPTTSRIVETLRVAREVGGTDLGRVLDPRHLSPGGRPRSRRA